MAVGAAWDGDIDTATLREYNLVNHRYAIHSAKKEFFDMDSFVTLAIQVEVVAILILTRRFIGFLPCQYATQLVRDGRLRAIRPDAVGLQTLFSLILPHNTPRGPLIRAFQGHGHRFETRRLAVSPARPRMGMTVSRHAAAPAP